MPPLDPPPSEHDLLLDRVLRGEVEDVEGALAAAGSLTEAQRARLRAVAALRAKPGRRSRASMGAASSSPGQIRNYRLEDELGRGRTGTVYRAKDTASEREVAVKLLRPELLASEAGREHFQREARLLARLRHPHAVRVRGVGSENGRAFLVMDLVEGESLDRVLQERHAAGKRPPIARMVRLLRDVARAAHAAHEAGIVHRNLKPSSIRVREDGHAVLTGFGLASDEALLALTQSGVFRGTPHHASPEQLTAAGPPLDARSDVHSMGAVLYEAITGLVPFPGETKEKVFAKILATEALPPRRLNPEVPRDLETIVARAMAKRPEDRYATMEALAEDLTAWLERGPIQARRPGPGPVVRGWLRAHWPLAFFLAGLLVAVSAFGIIFFEQRRLRAEDARERIERAEAMAAAGEFERALSEMARLVAQRPDDPQVRDARDRLVEKRRATRARQALAVARQGLREYREARTRHAASRSDLQVLQRKLARAYGSDAEVERLIASEGQLAVHAAASESAWLLTVEQLGIAEGLGADADEVRRARAELLHLRRLELKARGDRGRAAGLARRLAALDTEGRFFGGGSPPGRLRLLSDPPGVRVHLFRYRKHTELAGGGPQRDVPLPLRPSAEIRPGELHLRVRVASGSLAEGDLIERVAGHRLEDGAGVTEAGAGVPRGAALVRVGAERVHRPAEARHHLRAARERSGGEPLPWVFRTPQGEEMAVASERVLADPPRFAPWHEIVRGGGVAVRAYGEAGWRELLLEDGVATVPTRTPLPLDASSSVGPTPVEVEVAAGSWIALLRHPEHRLQRVPFVVEPGERAEVRVELPDPRGIPAGYVWVPPPPPERDERVPAVTGGFWIGEREVTGREYREFLAEPQVRAQIAASAELVRVPRVRVGSAWRPLGAERTGESWRITAPYLDRSIAGISHLDAAAYARFLTRRAARRGEGLVYSLPSAAEWELAARGSDGRRLPFGDRLIPRWVNARFGARSPGLEGPFSFPIDESPFGVFDLVGGLREWTSTPEAPGSFRVRGGDWRTDPADLEAAVLRGRARDDSVPDATGGFRLVIRRQP